MRALLLAIGLVAAGAAPMAPAVAADTVADQVFDAHLMAGVATPETFHYRYEMSGTLMGKPYTSRVLMEVRKVGPDGEKEVHFDMFDGPNHRDFGPMAAREQNPLVLIFLQRDVVQMGNLTGGSPEYFRHRIRDAFNAPADVSPMTIELDGKAQPATRVLIHPFRRDPHIQTFPQFEEKAYEFIVAQGVPGGLWRIATLTPGKDPAAGPAFEESMTFVDTQPPGRG
jgi:hypothetical protein